MKNKSNFKFKDGISATIEEDEDSSSPPIVQIEELQIEETKEPEKPKRLVDCEFCKGQKEEDESCPWCGVKPRHLWTPAPPKNTEPSLEELEICPKMGHPREPGYVYRFENFRAVPNRIKNWGWEYAPGPEGQIPYEEINEDGSKEILLRKTEAEFMKTLIKNGEKRWIPK